jgi:hypothetical protein
MARHTLENNINHVVCNTANAFHLKLGTCMYWKRMEAILDREFLQLADIGCFIRNKIDHRPLSPRIATRVHLNLSGTIVQIDSYWNLIGRPVGGSL